jgi:hypothetical protein
MSPVIAVRFPPFSLAGLKPGWPSPSSGAAKTGRSGIAGGSFWRADALMKLPDPLGVADGAIFGERQPQIVGVVQPPYWAAVQASSWR